MSNQFSQKQCQSALKHTIFTHTHKMKIFTGEGAHYLPRPPSLAGNDSHPISTTLSAPPLLVDFGYAIVII